MTIDNEERRVRVFGPLADPHFCARDLCEIMEIRDIKDTLQNSVSNTNKKELKRLLQTQRVNGSFSPNELVGLKNPHFVRFR